jgi:hypothetical protein
MRKKVYNLEFESWCPEFTIWGYRFYRVEDYEEKVKSLQHLVTGISEFEFCTKTGGHAVTAYVDIPDNELNTVLQWADEKSSALKDILILLSLFTGRDVFVVDEDFDENGKFAITADSRVCQWGGVLTCSIPYQASNEDPYEDKYNIGFEKGMNEIYSLIRSPEWLKKYDNGYFLILATYAFKRQILESSFIQCWTIWEHLFAVLNRKWLSKEDIIRLSSYEKISFLLVKYALTDEINNSARQRIKSLAEIRNKLIHFGRFPERDSVRDDAVLFIRLTEFVLAKILGLSPSNLFNTVERLEEFLTCVSKKK